MNAPDHPIGEGGPDAPPEVGRLVIRSAADLIAAIPYLLGFVPSFSLVVVGYGGPLDTCAMRIDLPLTERDRLVASARIVQVLTTNQSTAALLAGYGPASDVDPFMFTVREALTSAGLAIGEALRVHEGRWSSYLCTDSCCPPDGTPVDPDTTAVAVQAVFAGHVALADRDELVRSLAPETGPARQAMRRATEAAEQRLQKLRTAAQDATTPQDTYATFITEGITFIAELLHRIRSANHRATDDEIAWLGVLLRCLRLRDELLVRLDQGHQQADTDFLRDVVRRIDPAYAAPPASLLAYAAYLAGDGALANVALQRASAADPDYTLALLLREVLAAGISPSQIRFSATPAQLAEDDQRQPGHQPEPPGPPHAPAVAADDHQARTHRPPGPTDDQNG